MSTEQRDGIDNPAQGLIIYNTSTNRPNVFNGSYWLDFDGSLAGSLSIGDYYQGGIVFYLDGNGGGLVCALSDQTDTGGVTWYNDSFSTTGATDTAIGTGQANTMAIIGNQGSGNYAAQVCADLEMNGFSDWFMPSKDELNAIYQFRFEINAASIANGGAPFDLGANYWSSSEEDETLAWAQDFAGGGQYTGVKSNSDRVRAVRAISNEDNHPWTVNGTDIFNTAGGNVGIGTEYPENKLHILGSGFAGEGILLESSSGVDGADLGWKSDADGNWTIDQYGDNPTLRFSTYGISGFSTKIAFTASGNLGVGTDNPRALFDLYRNTTSLHGGPVFRLSRSYSGSGFGSAIYQGWGQKGETMVFGVANNGDPAAEGNEKMVITQGGNVGIGTTAPNSALQVDGTIHSTSGGFKFPDGTVQATASGSGGTPTLWSTNGNKIYYNDGNVGVSTSDPTEMLQVGDFSDASHNYVTVKTTGSSGNEYNAGLKFRHYNENYGWTLQSDDLNKKFHIIRHENSAGGTYAMSIDRETGNVGIGTDDPEYLLHVTGSNQNGAIASFENFGWQGEGSNDGIRVVLYPPGEGWGVKNNFMTFRSKWSNLDIVSGQIELWNLNERALPSGSFDEVVCQLVSMGIIVTDPIEWAALLAEWSVINLCNHHGVAYGSVNADYAEFIEKTDPGEMISSGMVVGVKDGKVSKVTLGADKVMAVSSNPAVIGNSVVDSLRYLHEIVAFLGQIPVWVRGTVNTGDYLVASGENNGVAIAVAPQDLSASQLTSIVGRAWESSRNPSLKTVKTVVGIDSGETAHILLKQQQRINGLEAKLDNLSNLEERIRKLEESADQKSKDLQASN